MQLPALSPSSERDQKDRKPEYERTSFYLLAAELMSLSYLLLQRRHVYQKEDPCHEIIMVYTQGIKMKGPFPPVFGVLKR